MVEERPTKMLVDTGSAVNILREDMWREVTSANLDSLSSVARPVVAANGQNLELSGDATVRLQVGILCVQTPRSSRREHNATVPLRHGLLGVIWLCDQLAQPDAYSR